MFYQKREPFIKKLFRNEEFIDTSKFTEAVNNLVKGEKIDEAYETIYKVLKRSDDVEVPPLPSAKRTLQESIDFFDNNFKTFKKAETLEDKVEALEKS